MKKAVSWIFAIALAVFIIDWGVMRLKIFDNDYNITVEAYIALVCFVLLFICAMYRIFSRGKCKHCGKFRWTDGEYCPYCGKKA